MTTQHEPMTLERVRNMSTLEKASLTREQRHELKTLLAQRRMDKMNAADVGAGLAENAQFCSATVEVLAYAIATMAMRFDRPDHALSEMTKKTVERLVERSVEIAAELTAGVAMFKAAVDEAKARGE